MRKIILLMVFLLTCVLCISCSCEDEGVTDTSSGASCEHYWDKGKIIKPATKEQPGEMSYTCLLCKEERKEGIPKLPHDHIYGEAWESDRMNHWHSCGVTNCTVKGEKGAHAWGDAEIIVEADQVTTGLKKYTCTVCAYQKEEEYRALAQLTEEELIKAISKEAFVSVTYIATRDDDTVTVEISKGYVKAGDTITEDSEANELGSHYLAEMLKGITFEDLEYDELTRGYNYNKDGTKAFLQFADAKLSVMILTKENTTVKYQFSKYGRTDFEIK